MTARIVLLFAIILFGGCELSEPSIIAIVTAIPVTLTAIGTLIVGLRSHKLINSNLSGVQRERGAANDRVGALQEIAVAAGGAKAVAAEAIEASKGQGSEGRNAARDQASDKQKKGSP